MKNLLINHPLLAECLEVLNAQLLPEEESEKIVQLFENSYPFTDWGKIDWSLIKAKKEIYDLQEIIPSLQKMLSVEIDQLIYILCDDAMIPIIKARLKDILDHFNKVDRISIHKFIFNPLQG